MPYSGTKDEINKKQRDYYERNKANMITKNTGWRNRNKEKVRKARQRLYQKNRVIMIEHQREYNFIKTFTKYGCCVNCFEINPFLIESHHVFEDDELTIGLCVKCHSLIHVNKKRTPEVLLFFD